MQKAERLFESIRPVKYTLELTPNLADFTYRGSEMIEFELTSESKELKFHADSLHIDPASIIFNGEPAQLSVSYDEKEQFVIFGFNDGIKAGAHSISFGFDGPIREGLRGFYRSKYMSDGKEQHLATTQFEPVAARDALVCIDEPEAKAVFELAIIIPENLTAISNTDPQSEEVLGTGLKKVTFAPAPKMSSYLLAFLVGEFERIETTNNHGTTVRVFTTPGKAEQGQFALDVAAKTLDFFTDYFGIPYPLTKLDMIAIPDFAVAAMENWGAVTYRETALLVDPKNTPLINQQHVAAVVAHELAHQWFGNLVTMKWWTDLWLNEGFATWVSWLALEHLYPEWKPWTQFVADDYLHARELDSLANTHPIEVEVHHPDEIEEIFDAISYEKGASAIRMLHAYLGEDDFRKGLNSYLNHFSYSNAVTGDLWEHLEKASGKPVKGIMSVWTSQPGHPLVSFEAANGKVKVSQERFFASPEEAKKYSSKDAWPVPVALITEAGQTDSRLVEEMESEIDVNVASTTWFKPNPNQAGFYVVKYTPEMIAALKSPIAAQTLAAEDRLGVLNDCEVLAKAGYLSTDQVLELASSMSGETDYTVWLAIFDALANILSLVDDEETRAKLEQLYLSVGEQIYAKLGWEVREGEDYFDSLLRPSVIAWAGRFGSAEVLDRSRELFKKHLNGTPIPGNLRAAVYGTVARHGSEQDYEAFLKLYAEADMQEEQRRLMGALAGFTQTDLLQRSLDMALSDQVRSQDSVIFILRVLSNRYSRELAWQFIQDNWQKLVDLLGNTHMLRYLATGLGDVFANYARAEEIENFFANRPKPGMDRSLKQAAESIRLRADWIARDLGKIQSFLQTTP